MQDPTTAETALAQIEALLEEQDAALEEAFRTARDWPEVELVLDARDLEELAAVAEHRASPTTIHAARAVRC